MTYAVTIEYGPNKTKIDEIRPIHREYLKQLLDSGILVVAGPLTDGTGGHIVYDVESEEKVEEVIKADPFYKHGIFQTWVIRPWKIVMGNAEKIPQGFPSA